MNNLLNFLVINISAFIILFVVIIKAPTDIAVVAFLAFVFTFIFSLFKLILIPTKRWIESEPDPVPPKLPPIVAYLKAVQEAKAKQKAEAEQKAITEREAKVKQEQETAELIASMESRQNFQNCFKLVHSEDRDCDHVVFVDDFGLGNDIYLSGFGRLSQTKEMNLERKPKEVKPGGVISGWYWLKHDEKYYYLHADRFGIVFVNTDWVDKTHDAHTLKKNYPLFTVRYGKVYDNFMAEKKRQREDELNEEKRRDEAYRLKMEEHEKQEIARKIKERHRKHQLEKVIRQELIESGELFGDQPERPRIPREVVDAIYSRDGGKCVYCGIAENLQLDHIIPFSKGGATSLENMQLLCQKCNIEKSNKIG